MNEQLVEYGIQTERTAWRAHVCFHVAKVYVYPTANGVDALNKGQSRYASQKGITTARGVAVPCDAIVGVREMDIPSDIMARRKPDRSVSTSEKGQAAVDVVVDMLHEKHGLMPVRESTSRVEQISGCDLRVDGRAVQVKCDYFGGKGPGATGNLFLQTHECNPFQKH